MDYSKINSNSNLDEMEEVVPFIETKKRKRKHKQKIEDILTKKLYSSNEIHQKNEN